MSAIRLTFGPFAGFAAELIEDRGDMVRVAVDIFGRRTEIDVEREHTDLPPLPPVVLPPLDVVLDELDAWMTEGAPEVRAAHGTTDEDALRMLAALGPATDDLAALYRRFGGTDEWQGFANGLELVPLHQAFATREMMNGLEQDGTFYRWMPNEWWNPAWLPFLDNHSYDMICLDVVGTMGGTPGQVVRWSKDSASRSILAPSLSAWLGAFVAGRREGAWIWDEHTGIQIAPGREADEPRLLRRFLPDYPRPTEARSRKDVLGVEPPPAPPSRVHSTGPSYEVVKQFWAPESGSVHALAYLADRDLLAVGQYDWGENPGGLSLVDPHTGDLVSVLIGKDDGSALELATMPNGGSGVTLVVRRLRHHHNQVVAIDGDALQVLRMDLPTRMEAFVAVAAERRAIAISADPIELVALAGDGDFATIPLAVADVPAIVGLSPDARVLAVAQRDQPLRWFDTRTGDRLGTTEEPVLANRLEFGIDGDLWVAGNRGSHRFDLATGRAREHDAAHTPFVIALHRGTGRIAFAGYGGRVLVLDARSGRTLAEDDAGAGRVYGLVWDAAGERLWSGDDAGQIVERRMGA